MAKKTQTPPSNFEDALLELDKILSDIEKGQVGLEESLIKYERGNFLIQHCRGVLNAAEKQVELLSRGADGSLTAAPLKGVSDGGGSTEEPDAELTEPTTPI